MRAILLARAQVEVFTASTTCSTCSRSLGHGYGRSSVSTVKKRTVENVVWSPNCCSLLGNRGR